MENLVLMIMPAGLEWVFLIAAVAIVFFGVKKVPELARSFGKAKGEYEKARIEGQKEIDKIKRVPSN